MLRDSFYCMGRISVADALELSVPERIQLVEDIWDSIAAVPGTFTLSEAQRTELNRRLEQHRKDPNSGSPWEEVKRRLVTPE